MRSLAIQRFRRSELERRIEEMIALLDIMDGDPDLEDCGDADWSGDGVTEALRMIEASPAASRRADEYADTPRPPLVYDFRGSLRR